MAGRMGGEKRGGDWEEEGGIEPNRIRVGEKETSLIRKPRIIWMESLL